VSGAGPADLPAAGGLPLPPAIRPVAPAVHRGRTGAAAGSRGPGAALEFEPEGQLAAARDGEAACALPAGFEDQPITVRRFWLPDRRLGISDIPAGLLGLPRDPALFTAEDWAYVRSSEFFEWGNYALRCGCASAGLNQLFVSRDGECLLHSV